MLKKKILLLPLLSVLVSSACYSQENIIVSFDSENDAAVYNMPSGGIIDIFSKNEDNIAHVYYDSFNVTKNGAAIHNSVAANVIINEIISNEETLLEGNLSLVGQPAKVIIANPNGIECRDCSFRCIDDINLVTGKTLDIYQQEFDLQNGKNIALYYLPESGMKIREDGREIPLNYYNLRLISNGIKHFGGVLNAYNLRIDTGLNTFSFLKENEHVGTSTIDLMGDAINTRNFVLKGGNGNVHISDATSISALALRINTNQKVGNLYRTYDNDNSTIKINQDDNIYRTVDDSDRHIKSYIKASHYLVNQNHYIDNGELRLDIQENLDIGGQVYLDNARLLSRARNININAIGLSHSYAQLIAQEALYIADKISGFGSVYAKAKSGNYDRQGKINIISKNEKVIKHTFNDNTSINLGLKYLIKDEKVVASNLDKAM